MRLAPEVEDVLDRHNASSELMLFWAARQEQLNAGAAFRGRVPLHEAARVYCLKYMGMVARLYDESETAWFEPAAVFDFYCARWKMSEEELIAQAPSVCTAIVLMCAKLDCVSTGRRRLGGLSRHASQLADALGRIGHRVDTCTRESLNAAEKSILEVLDWDLCAPSLEMWTSFFCRRFNVITRGMFDQSLSWVQGQSRFLARIVVLRTHHGDGGFCARRMAEGIVAFALVSAGIIPEHILRPHAMGYSVEGWQDLLRGCQPNGVLPACNVDESRENLLLQILTVVNVKDTESIRESCALACETVRSAVQAASDYYPCMGGMQVASGRPLAGGMPVDRDAPGFFAEDRRGSSS